RGGGGGTGPAQRGPRFGRGWGAIMVRKFWKYIGAITNVGRANPAADCRVDAGFSREVRDLDAPAGQLLAVRQRRPDEVFDPGGAGGLHGRRADLGLTRHLRGSQKLVTTKAPCAPQRGTEGARVDQLALAHLDSPRCQRPRSVAGRIAAGNTYRELARARSASTTPPPCRPVPPSTATTCLVIIVSLCRMRRGAQGRAAPARRFSLTPKPS